MKNQDELRGKAESFKGRMKEAAGDLSGDQRLHDEGVADEITGNVKEGFGKARRKVGEALDDVADDLKR